MNFKRLLLFLAAPLALVMSSCEPDGPVYTTPSISITDADGAEVTAVNFSAEGGDATITITATRGWSISKQATWLGVTPSTYTNDTMEEKSVDVKITVGPNDGDARTETIKVVMDKVEKNVVVSQAGEGQTALGEDLYYDNFDKKAAETDSNGYWPYMSAEYGNPTPENQSGVTYASKNVTVRNNSNSNGKFSDIADKASGVNNVFFGKENYLTISGISLAELTGNALTVTFAGDKYQQNGDSNFSTEEFKVYISGDGEKWTLLPYTFAGTTEGRWNTATAQFNFKEVPETLSFYFTATVASVYRLDDLKLTAGGGGAEIDLSQGIELEIESGSGNTGGGDQGGDQGGETPAPENALLWASFATDMANFTTENVELGGLDYVWYHDAKYKQMKASAYKDNVRYVTESYLVSPVVALTGAEDYYMNFEHTGKFFGNMSEQATLWVREEGGAWAQLTIPTYMTGNDWNFVNSGDIALTAYAGKNIQIGFRYTSTATDAPTWEVKNVLVAKGTAGETPEQPVQPEQPEVELPEGAIVWNTNASSQTWAAETHETLGAGYSATVDNLKVGYYKHEYNNDMVEAKDDHIRVYKKSALVITPLDGKTITKVVMLCADPISYDGKEPTHYTFDLSVADGSTATANQETKVITWEGSIDEFEAYAVNGQVRIKTLAVVLDGEGGGNTEPEDPEDPETPVDPEEPTTVTLDEITAEGTYNITGATVVAVEYKQMIVKGTEKMLNVKNLEGAAANYNVGEVLNLTNAVVKDSYGAIVIDGADSNLVIEKTEATVEVAHPTATTADAAWITSWLEGKTVEYVTATGNAVVSTGNEYALNVAVEGSETVLSVSFPTKEEAAALNNHNVTVSGYAFDYYSSNNYISVMLVSATDNGAIEEPEQPEDPAVVKVTVAEFKAAAEDETVYELTGVIKDTYNTYYGNFYLEDESGDVLIYGILNDGEKCYESLGLVDGDIITVQGTRVSYNDAAQMKNAEYVSHIVNTTPRILRLDVTSLLYTADAAEKTIKVTTAGEGGTLEATTAAEWLTVSVADGVVTVAAAANEGEAREAEVTVTFGDSSETVAVSQAAPVADGAEVADVIDSSFTGVTGTTYVEWSGKTGISGAVYAGQCAGDAGTIQLRSKNSNSGVVTTTSGGKVTKIVITWNTTKTTNTNRTVDIYGSHTAFSQATDMYNSTKADATKIASAKLANATNGVSEVVLDGTYEFVGFRSNDGALYLDSVEITWVK